MPRAPKKCAHLHCETRVVGRSHCPQHTPAWAGPRTAASHQSRAAGQRQRRTEVLARDPSCRCRGCPACTASGCTRQSTDDDHIINVAAGGNNDLDNHQGLCHPCHRLKIRDESRAGRR